MGSLQSKWGFDGVLKMQEGLQGPRTVASERSEPAVGLVARASRCVCRLGNSAASICVSSTEFCSLCRGHMSGFAATG
jgi:hypothetical protein